MRQQIALSKDVLKTFVGIPTSGNRNILFWD